MESSDLRDAQLVVDWMRKVGASQFRRGDLEITLGPAPAPAPLAPRFYSDEELIARAKKIKQQQDALLFASSEGFPDDFEDE